jgi:hypothetical protein
MRRAKFWQALITAALIASTAHAQPAQQAPTGGPEMWDLSDPASPRHWFSGLRCWDEVVGAPFTQRVAYDPTGGDVSCGYVAADYFITVYATLRRAPDASYDAVVEQTAQQVRSRYGRTETLKEGARELSTARGAVAMHELVLRVGGRDSMLGRDQAAVTGVWHVDVAGWTLKLRLTATPEHSLAWMREQAEAILRRAYEDLETARACAGAGMTAPARIELDEEKSMQTAVWAVAFGVTLSEAAPGDLAAARRAGFVCLGSAFSGPNGAIAMSVTPLPTSARPSLDFDARIVSLGEIREGDAARRIAVFDMPLDPVAAERGETSRGHLVFAFEETAVYYYGPTFDRPADSGGRAAAAILAGREPVMSVTRDGPQDR